MYKRVEKGSQTGKDPDLYNYIVNPTKDKFKEKPFCKGVLLGQFVPNFSRSKNGAIHRTSENQRWQA